MTKMKKNNRAIKPNVLTDKTQRFIAAQSYTKKKKRKEKSFFQNQLLKSIYITYHRSTRLE